MRKVVEYWRYPAILLVRIGIASIGSWIYFLALNVIVFNMTGSPLAVAILYIIKPLATLFTNLWGGSVIDRVNKKHLMIILDIIQATLIACLAMSIHALWVIYLLVFLINIATSIFEPTSVSYVTRLIPREQRQRFNSLRSLLDSGAFLLGPAIGALLFLVESPLYAIMMNAFALYLSAFITLFMPNVEKHISPNATTPRLTLNLIKEDLKVVIQFSRRFAYVMIIYFLFSVFIVMQTAVDSLEVSFAKEVISLSDSDYLILVSIAGLGILIGSFINAIFTKKLTIVFLISMGSLMVSIGYLIFAFSSQFMMASVGVFLLGFSLAFANTGFYTFYQNNIPVEVIGRIGSIYGFLEALLVIIATSLFAALTMIFPIKFVVVLGAIIMFVLTSILLLITLQPTKRHYFSTSA
ncbi:MFS transporter [Paucisalibacillus globulus]|uniref:MFS transporter n=1 Tax=Paucisalibacillus globulus TaxID=351095 RepID=UPI000BB7EB24|nr:MFS transporter [Paucisalibacillus globulus]